MPIQVDDSAIWRVFDQKNLFDVAPLNISEYDLSALRQFRTFGNNISGYSPYVADIFMPFR
jgi:hypothetical protein